MNTLTVGDLEFEIRRSVRRRSMQITVDRSGELVLTAPESCPSEALASFVREKRFWIYTKLAAKEALGPRLPPKRFVNGEGFAYLGRSHRLLLVRDQDASVKLDEGRFKIRLDAVKEGRHHMIRWYTTHAQRWLEQRVSRFADRLGVAPSAVVVQDLGYRWGSCASSGRLFFHWRTILLPPRIIEYLVAHEVVHLLEPNHTPAFWRRVERTLPDFALRKQWLLDHPDAATL